MLPLKNAFLKEAKTVKTGTKFIIRDTAQVGEHTEKQFVYLRQKQGRDAHRRARVWASSLTRRKAVKRQ